VQANKNGNGVVAFRTAPALSPDAVTVIKLTAPGRLENRLGLGVVNESFNPRQDTAKGGNPEMVCSGVNGVGAIVSADEFVSETNQDDRVALLVQVDVLEREVIIFRRGTGGTSTTNSSTKAARVDDTRRCFDESQDSLVGALKIPSHWQTCYFAVDLYGYGDQVLMEDASRWVSGKKKRRVVSKATSMGQLVASLPARQSNILEELLGTKQEPTAAAAASAQSPRAPLDEASRGRFVSMEANNPLGPQQQSFHNHAAALMPLLSQSTLRELVRSKSSDAVIDLHLAVKFQSWLYRRAVALKPVVTTQQGVEVLREPLVAPLCLRSIRPPDRGVTLRLVRDAHHQCGQVAVRPTTTVREMAPQLIAWSREYACSAAEVFAATDEYLSAAAAQPTSIPWLSSALDKSSPATAVATPAAPATPTELTPTKARLPLQRQQYVCDEVRPAAHYISYSWDLPWRTLVDGSIPEALAGFHDDDALWIDVFSFNYAGRLGPGQVSPLPAIQRTIAEIGSTVVLLDDTASALGRLWCLVEILMTVAPASSSSSSSPHAADLTLCFLDTSTRPSADESGANDTMLAACLAAAGRFDTVVDVGTAKCAGSKHERKVLRGWLQRNFQSNKQANARVATAVREAAVKVLETDKRAGFSKAEINAFVAFVRGIGVHRFVDVESGKRNHVLWDELEGLLFGTE
jgi:hypothetical protein